MQETASALSKTMAEFFLENPPKDFKPCAYYSKSLDCIYVLTKNCSFTEARVNAVYTVFLVNHKNGNVFAGFCIKGISKVFQEFKHLSTKDDCKVADIIQAASVVFPDAYDDLIKAELAHTFDFLIEGLQV